MGSPGAKMAEMNQQELSLVQSALARYQESNIRGGHGPKDPDLDFDDLSEHSSSEEEVELLNDQKLPGHDSKGEDEGDDENDDDNTSVGSSSVGSFMRLTQLVQGVLQRYTNMVDSSSSPKNEEQNVAEESQDNDSKLPSYFSQTAADDLDKAIRMLPEADKAAYCEMKQKAPDLLMKESNPQWYLTCEKGNTWNAAKKLASYWKDRFHYFQERALLPMNQTGEGALNKRMVRLLRTGFFAFLPPDPQGRSVIFTDTGRRCRETDPTTHMCYMFYTCHILLQNPLTPSKGIIHIIPVGKEFIRCVSTYNKDVLNVVQRSMPFGAAALHLIPRIVLRPKRFMDNAIPMVFNHFSKRCEKSNQHFHNSSSNESILQALEGHGLSRQNLPESIGGQWSYDINFEEWQDLQIRKEWGLPLGSSMFGDEHGIDEERKRAGGNLELTEEERQERKRRYNVLHSRRKRMKQRFEADAMKERAQELRDEKEHLLRKHQELLDLLQQAESHVAAMQSVAAMHSTMPRASPA